MAELALTAAERKLLEELNRLGVRVTVHGGGLVESEHA